MIKVLILTSIVFLCSCYQISPPQLTKQQVLDESEVIRLAEQQKFIIPLNGRTISHKIEYIPANNGQCQFISPTIQYKSLAQSQTVFKEQDEIMAILPLMIHEIVFIADPYYNLAVYSIDQHSLLKSLAPKKSLKTFRNESDVISPLLVATEDQRLVYYLTPTKGYVFEPNTLSSQLQQFNINNGLDILVKAVSLKNFIIIASQYSGLHLYEIQKDNTLKHLQQIKSNKGKSENSDTLIDMQLDKQRHILYLLYDKKIDVYIFDLPDYYNNVQAKNILQLYDTISLSKITFNHGSDMQESNQHKNLEISRSRTQQNLFVLFKHNKRSIIAEIVYSQLTKQFVFVRYYKFIMQIHQIHAIQDVIVVVGVGILGMFPYGIDPRLLEQEFNGFMTLTSIQKLVITQIPFFVSITKNTIQYGGIFFNNHAGLNCHINQTSKLKSIKFLANLTTCTPEQSPSFKKYCQYEKMFIIQQMDLSISAPVADTLWIGMILFSLLIVVGICSMFMIHKRKQKQIKKLELYFQQKRRSEVPPSSDRNAREGL